jgi:protease-4
MKSFFKWLGRLLGGVIILTFLFFITISLLIESEPEIGENSYISINIRGAIPEYIPPDPFEEALGNSQLDIKNIRDILEKAIVDERVNGVLLKIGFLQVGFGAMQELQTLILNFREKTDKKIIAYLNGDIVMMKDYYLAIACDSIYMPPETNLFLGGISAEVTFYKDFFKKYGVEAEFLHVGKYKSAPETYTRSDISQTAKQVLNEILDQYYDEMVQFISLQRNISVNKIKNLIDSKTGFTGKEAQAVGLIDNTRYTADFAELFKISKNLPKAFSGKAYAKTPASSLKIRDKSRIAVVYCTGAISSGSNSEDMLLGELAGAKTLIANLNKAASSSLNKAIILRIDSPGGSASASDLMWKAVKEAAEKKPLIASISSYGASGGYYIAMPADTIIANNASLIGSIGVFAGKFSFEGVYDYLKINNHTITRGKNANLFSLNQKWTPSEKRVVQNLIENFYETFIRKAAEGRNTSLAHIEQNAQGRVWTGKQALQKGLIDLNGGFYDAVRIAAEAAGIDSSESVRLVYYPRKKSFFKRFLSSVQVKLGLFQLSIPQTLEKFEKTLMRIQNKPMALMPFRIEW